MTTKLTTVAVAALVLLVSCSHGDNETARQQAKQTDSKARHDLHELGTEAKQDARRLRSELEKGMNGDVKPSAAEAQRKLEQAGTIAQTEAQKAGRALDHAAVIARVKAKLASDVGLSSMSRVQVEYKAGLVTLRGSVASPEQKRQAEQAASQADGVQHVQNELTVEP